MASFRHYSHRIGATRKNETLRGALAREVGRCLQTKAVESIRACVFAYHV